MFSVAMSLNAKLHELQLSIVGIRLGNEFPVSAWMKPEAPAFLLEVQKGGGAMLCNAILASFVSYLPSNFTVKVQGKVN
jgi:hypothetical protein